MFEEFLFQPDGLNHGRVFGLMIARHKHGSALANGQ
jgi:hypothetical protein